MRADQPGSVDIPWATSLALSLALIPAPAAADGMGAAAGAAVGGAVIAAGGLSILASALTLIVAIVYRRRRRRTLQLLARTLVVMNLIGHLGFALMLSEYAIVLIPGVALGLLAAWVDWRTEPPVDEHGQPRPLGVQVAGTVLAILVVLGVVWAATVAAEKRRMEAADEALIEAQAALVDPQTPAAERSAALDFVLAHFGECPLDGLDLSGFDLSTKMVERCTFVGTNLSGANMTETYAIGVDFSQTELAGATLYKARLEQTNLSGRDLRGVDLREAELTDADLSDAKLDGARLDGVYVSGCKLDGASVTVEQLASTDPFYGVEGLAETFEAEVLARQAARTRDSDAD